VRLSAAAALLLSVFDPERSVPSVPPSLLAGRARTPAGRPSTRPPAAVTVNALSALTRWPTLVSVTRPVPRTEPRRCRRRPPRGWRRRYRGRNHPVVRDQVREFNGPSHRHAGQRRPGPRCLAVHRVTDDAAADGETAGDVRRQCQPGQQGERSAVAAADGVRPAALVGVDAGQADAEVVAWQAQRRGSEDPQAARAFAMATRSAPSDALEVSVTAPVTGSMIIAVRE